MTNEPGGVVVSVLGRTKAFIVDSRDRFLSDLHAACTRLALKIPGGHPIRVSFF